MKHLFLLLFLLFIVACNDNARDPYVADVIENNSTRVLPLSPTPIQFQSLWSEVISDPETTLPQEEVSYEKLFDGVRDLISEDAHRTLEDHADLLEPFDKLAHPNGVCLKGIWRIDTPNPYSGYFALGSEALIVARASTALSETKRGETRAFGMAGKLFATTNPLEEVSWYSANFFVIDDLGGTDAEYYTDVQLTNEPEVSFTSSVFSAFAYGLKVANAFRGADKNSGIRQLYEISSLGEQDQSAVVTPRWMKIEAEENQTKFGVGDFRDEFVLHKGEKLVFFVSVASKKVGGEQLWKKIGTITFDSSVVSGTCDHRLHFHHPKWRDDLVYE